MAQSRRVFLQTLGAGVAIVSLPEISSILNLCSFPGSSGDDLEATLRRLLLGRSTGGEFVAHADTRIIEGTPQQLLDAPSALLKTLDDLKLDRSFSGCVNYTEASQCRDNFKRREEEWRRGGFEDFTDVKRSPRDKDVAVLLGGNIDRDSNLNHAAGATQYQQSPAIPLHNHDPGVTRAAWWLLNKNLSGKELAQGLAVIEKRNIKMDDGQTSTRYETPVSASVYIPRPRHKSQVSNAVGIVATHNKNEPNSIYFADLYA